MNKRFREVILPLITAFIWGTAFVAQKNGGNMLGALSFNWIRMMVAAVGLLILVIIREKRNPIAYESEEDRKKEKKQLWSGGLVVGTILAIASSLQQYGVNVTTAAKAGFINSLYIVIVPLLGLFLGRKVKPKVWCAVAVSILGLYFLNFTSEGVPSFNSGDLCILACSFVLSLHILTIDHYTNFVDELKLSCIQFFVAAVEVMVIGLIYENLTLQAVIDCLPYILYTGIVSNGIGYTLQILAQKEGDPTVVSILLSLEAFFAVLSGALILHETVSIREAIGCMLMFCAVILVNLPEKKKA